MEYLPQKGWRRIAVLAFYALLALAILRFGVYVVAGFLLPFLIAWLAAALLHPLTLRIHRHTRISYRFVCIFCMACTLTLPGILLVSVCGRLFDETMRLLEMLNRDAPTYMESFFAFLDNLGERIPLIRTLTRENQKETLIISAVESALSAASAHLPDWIGALIAALPDLLLFCVMTVIAAFYISADFDRINVFLCAQLPPRAVVYLRRLKRRALDTGFRYLRAYAILMAITFVELLIGFWMLRVEYAFTLAIFTAVIDILPVLGIGTVLLPWAAALLLTGNYGQGIGILALFGILTLIRHFLEPKILGASLGLYPLATLVALYAGYRISGIGGMLLFPILLILLKDIHDSGVPVWRDPPKENTPSEKSQK